MFHRHSSMMTLVGLALFPLLILTGCGTEEPPPVEGLTTFVGGSVFDGTGSDPIEDAVLVVREGRIEAIGPMETIPIPDGAERIDVSGKTIIPGIIVTHAHVGEIKGLERSPENYTEENVLSQLALYARYGVTTVVSLGAHMDPADMVAGFAIHDAQETPQLDRARLYMAGFALDGKDPDRARAQVNELADMGVDLIKLRIDDDLGTREKTTPEFYRAVIDQAHQRGLKVTAHLYYLEDAKGILDAGVDFLAHSVRDQEVDEEFIAMLKERKVCQSPTLVRELVSYVYEDVPDFFEDPFFLKEADRDVIEQLKDPARQQTVRESRSAQAYKQAQVIASKNLKKLVDAGATVAFGTDSGPPSRFQGYFEHLEMDLMAQAGLTPTQILVSATGNAAHCLGLDDLGTLEPGKWADLVILTDDPLVDIENVHSIDSVWIAGNRVPGREEGRTAETE